MRDCEIVRLPRERSRDRGGENGWKNGNEKKRYTYVPPLLLPTTCGYLLDFFYQTPLCASSFNLSPYHTEWFECSSTMFTHRYALYAAKVLLCKQVHSYNSWILLHNNLVITILFSSIIHHWMERSNNLRFVKSYLSRQQISHHYARIICNFRES